MASSSNSPCAACKFLRRKCTQECVFAPYFPPDQPTKFANVHKVFGASNVAKILNELNPTEREDAVNSLAYEAEARLRDPVYGCVGLISILQHQLRQVQLDLANAKKELANYIGPSAMLPLTHHPPSHRLIPAPLPHQNASSNPNGPYGMSPMGLGLPPAQAQLFIREQQQQMMEAQHMAAVVAAREQQEMMRNYAQQQQHQEELVRFNGAFDESAVSAAAGSSTGGFNQMSSGLPSSLALASFDNPFHVQQTQQEHHHQQHPQQRAGSDEIKSVDPSS